MAGLLKLSNEILLEIGSYLTYADPGPLTQHRPYFHWTQELRHRNEKAFLCIKDLRALARTCRQLHRPASTLLCARIPLIRTENFENNDPDRTQSLVKALETDHDLASRMKVVHVNIDKYNDPIDFRGLFFLPNIRELGIEGADNWEGWDGDNESLIGTSSVEVLRLVRCGAREQPLTQMLSWPRNLKELWYHVKWGEWEGYVEGTAPIEFSCAAVVRAMSSQANSLEKLVMWRDTPDHEGLGYFDLLNVRRFEKLRSLCVNQAFLTSFEPDAEVWEHLPRSLEELDVHYDDFDYVGIFSDDAPRPGWLLGLLDRMSEKQDFTPSLQRVRLTCQESQAEEDEEDEDDESNSDGGSNLDNNLEMIPGFDETRGVGAPDSTWRPPRMLVESFIRAGVSFSFMTGLRHRYRYVVKDGQGFKDDWEDHITDWTYVEDGKAAEDES